MTVSGSPDDPQVAELRQRQQQRLARMFRRFALIELFVLVAVILVVFVLQVVDGDLGVWVLIATALISGAVLVTLTLTAVRRNQQELRDLGLASEPSQTTEQFTPSDRIEHS